MSVMAFHITSLMIVYSNVYSSADQRKYRSSASLAFVRDIHRWPVNSPQKKVSNAENVSIWWRHHGEEMDTHSPLLTHCTWHIYGEFQAQWVSNAKLWWFALCMETLKNKRPRERRNDATLKPKSYCTGGVMATGMGAVLLTHIHVEIRLTRIFWYGFSDCRFISQSVWILYSEMLVY